MNPPANTGVGVAAMDGANGFFQINNFSDSYYGLPDANGRNWLPIGPRVNALATAFINANGQAVAQPNLDY